MSCSVRSGRPLSPQASIEDLLPGLLGISRKPVVTVYDGLHCLGEIVEREGVFDGVRADGRSVGRFETIEQAAAALVEERETECPDRTRLLRLRSEGGVR